MPPEILAHHTAAEMACFRFMEVFRGQSSEGRAAIVGFLHLSTGSNRIEAVLTVSDEGRVALMLEAAGTIQD